MAAQEEAKQRIAARAAYAAADLLPSQIPRALSDPSYTPPKRRESLEEQTGGAVRTRQVRGQPAGPGIAKGPARVILEREELTHFKSGEILVCDALDPNMTFVVPLCAGIVERRGGMLIHGAIIAREYGLPCVTGVPDATGAIRTGDQITVDGYLGIITIA